MRSVVEHVIATVKILYSMSKANSKYFIYRFFDFIIIKVSLRLVFKYGIRKVSIVIL